MSTAKRWTPPARRRIYLMRHGSVDYFSKDGRPVPPDTVPLNEKGLHEARAAGRLFAESGVRFDRVVVSGLTRTVQTAQEVLAQAQQTSLHIDIVPELVEIKPGHLPSFLADMPKDRTADAFTRAFAQDDIDQPFLGGETVRSLLTRVLPAFEKICADASWQTLLLVLHGGVNRAIIGTALNASPNFAGGLEQNPACINIMDIRDDNDSSKRQYTIKSSSLFAHISIRSLNITPTEYLHFSEQRTTMEKLWMEFESLQSATSKS